MNNSRDSYRTSRSRPNAGPPERRMLLAGMIRRKLLSVAEREQQRSQLINVLILAQALFTLAITIGYVGTKPAVASIVVGCVALLVYIAALVTNRAFHRVSLAAYLFVAGGSIAIAVQVLLQALAGNATQAGQAALLFAAVILEAGLLFAPEVTLIAATVTTIYSAFAILLALSVTPVTDRHQAYLLVVYTLGLQALASLIAWLLAQFIYESALEAQRSEELQFAQARLDALSAQVNDQVRVQDDNVRQIQETITRALGGEYTARLDLLDGQLAPLTESMNLLLQRVEIAAQAEQMRSRLEAAALPLIDSIAHMADASTPTPSSLPIMTNTPLDSLALVLNQMQTTVAQRLGRVQRLATDIVGALGHSQEGLTGTMEAVQEAQRIAGAVIATLVETLEAARRQVALAVQMRRMLAAVLPPEITQMAAHEDTPRDATGLAARESAELLGLGPDLGIANAGYTAEFDALHADAPDSRETGIAPMTVPLPIVKLTPEGDSDSESDSDSDSEVAALATTAEPAQPDVNTALARTTFQSGELPIELVEVWTLLDKLGEDLSQAMRTIGQVRRELGLQSRNIRTADANIAWLRQALKAVRDNAEQLQQAAGANLPPPGLSDAPASPSRPLPMRGPQKTRPLADRIEDESLAELAERSNLPSAPFQRDTGTAGYTPIPEPPRDSDIPAAGSMRLADLIELDSPVSEPLYQGPTSGPLRAPAHLPRPDTPWDRQ